MGLQRRCAVISAWIFLKNDTDGKVFPNLNRDTSFVTIRGELELLGSFEVH